MTKVSFLDRLQARVITPLVDNKLWLLKDNDKSITNIYEKIHENKFSIYYPDLDLEKLKEERLNEYEFLKHKFTSYIFTIDDAILEPEHGWVIIKPFSIFTYSFPMVNDPWDKIKRRPSTWKFFINRKKIKNIEEAISIRYAWQNYYHFFIDTLSQLYRLEKEGVPNHIPVIVPYYFPDIKFVREFLELTTFVKRKLIIQKKNEYFKVSKLYVSKDTFFSNGIYNVIHSVGPYRNTDKKRRIFVYRPLDHGRAILNLEEIKELVTKFGFEVVDSSQLSLEQQISLFSESSDIIGIHGAGLTNVIFRYGHPLRLLEIFPGKELTPEHYRNLSKKLNFNYSCIEGNIFFNNAQKNFNLSATVLKEKMFSFFGFKEHLG